jgi:hypothetical protein
MYRDDWSLYLRGGKPWPRGQDPTPCRSCPKSKDGKPNPGAELRGRRYRAWKIYWRVKAGMPMPDDAVIQNNCATIEEVLAQIRLHKQDVTQLLGSMIFMR